MTDIELIQMRLDKGLYREIQITRYFVCCDSNHHYGVFSSLTEDFVNTTRYKNAWEAEQVMTQMNTTEGPIIVDVEGDIRTLLARTAP